MVANWWVRYEGHQIDYVEVGSVNCMSLEEVANDDEDSNYPGAEKKIRIRFKSGEVFEAVYSKPSLTEKDAR